MFGSKKKVEQVERERREREETKTLIDWFDTLAAARPTGVGALTEGLIHQVGDPYDALSLPQPGPGTLDLHPSLALRVVTVQKMGRMEADARARRAVLDSDEDRWSRSAFWESVSGWL